MFRILRMSNTKSLKQLKKRNKLSNKKNNKMIYNFKRKVININLGKKLIKMKIYKIIKILIFIMIPMKALKN